MLNVKALVGASNQEKALVEAFFVIVKLSGTFGYPSFEALLTSEELTNANTNTSPCYLRH